MDDDGPAYSRQRAREGRLPVSTKFYQAIGGLPDAIKTWAFNIFLLLYYSQILGLPASWVSGVLTLSVLIDAITDPLVGSYSDSLKTKWGRRHPLMYAAILPLGLCLYCVFAPPAGLSELALLAWLALFAVGTRVAMTFYLIPWTAMFAELSERYEERSAILVWRYLVGGVGTLIFSVLVLRLLFPSNEAFPQGQLNPAGYPAFAIIISVTAMIAAFLTTFLTHREVPYLLQPTGSQVFGLRRTVGDLADALRNSDFLLLFAGLLLSAFLTGTLAALEIYLNTYFWGFTSEDLSIFAIAGLGGVLAFILVPRLQRHFDKKHLLIAMMALSISNGIIIIGLRFTGLLPANGEPLLLAILVVNEVFRLCVTMIIVVMFISMVADTLDAQELKTGKRQEGVFSAAIAFSNKAISGFGILVAGLLLEGFIRLPRAAGGAMSAADVPSDVIFRLVLSVIFLSLLYSIPLWLVRNYKISRAHHQQIRAELDKRRYGLPSVRHPDPESRLPRPSEQRK